MRGIVNRASRATGLVVVLLTTHAFGGVIGTVAKTTAEVRQIEGGAVVQSDLSLEAFPNTTPLAPVTSRARLDHLDPGGLINGSAQALAIFNQPLLTGTGVPNDAGLEISAFSDDHVTRWFGQGSVDETRSIEVSLLDVTTGFRDGDTVHLRSRVLLSGVLILTALDSSRDLTGAEVRLYLSVSPGRVVRTTDTPLVGQVTLRGGPNGAVAVDRIGVFETINLPVVDLNAMLPNLPLVKAVFFTGVNIPYEYDAVIGQAFDLELIVGAGLDTLPGGTGGAAVFGVPQFSLGDILQRVKGDDRGVQLANIIAQHVDTTGQAYAGRDDEGVATQPLGGSGLCGAMGPALAAVPLTFLMRMRRRPRRR